MDRPRIESGGGQGASEERGGPPEGHAPVPPPQGPEGLDQGLGGSSKGEEASGPGEPVRSLRGGDDARVAGPEPVERRMRFGELAAQTLRAGDLREHHERLRVSRGPVRELGSKALLRFGGLAVIPLLVERSGEALEGDGGGIRVHGKSGGKGKEREKRAHLHQDLARSAVWGGAPRAGTSQGGRNQPHMIEEVVSHPKVTTHLGTALREVIGTQRVEAVRAAQRGQPEEIIPVAGAFIYLQGGKPITDFLQGQLPVSETGCLVVDKEYQTALPGVYAVGDVLCNHVKQAVIAAAEGAAAAIAIEKQLQHRRQLAVDWAK